MTKNVDYFAKEFEKQKKKFDRIRPANIAYGSNVMPILQMYEHLSSSEERENYRLALEKLLTDPDSDNRKFAVDICLGFLIFKDAL